MKKKIVIALLVIIPSLAFSQEAKFHKNIPWADALKMAKKQNKHIFVDAYTDWCYWCKVMDKKTFTDAKVIDVLNNKFISVKLDAEKGEGIQFASRFNISGYPTVLFFSPNGMLVKKTAGYLDVENFLTTSEVVLKDDGSTSSVDGNKLDIGFPEFYTISFDPAKRKKTDPKIVDEFLSKQKNLKDEVSWSVMTRFSLSDKYSAYFLENKDAYIKKYGESEVGGLIRDISSKKLKSAIKSKSEKEFDNTITFVKENFLNPKNIDLYIEHYKKEYYQGVGEWMKFANMIDAENTNENQLNSYSWNIYEKCDNKEVIKMTCDWMKIAVEKDPTSYAITDTYAAILYKSGNLKEAKIWAEKAIEVGKADGQDVKETETLLEKINAKK